MPKITPRKTQDREVISAKTKSSDKKMAPGAWWTGDSQQERVTKLLGTVAFLKEQQQYRYRQAGVHSRLYSNYPLFGWAGMNLSRIHVTASLPNDRPTLNVIQSCIDTLVSRIAQARPRPMFLTDGGDYKQRNLAKKLNNFIQGEFYQTDAYMFGERALRDACILGDGIVKVFEKDKKVALERRLLTELLVDPNDGLYGCPRQLYELQLVDRALLAEIFPKHKSDIQKAEQAYPDTGGESAKTISDQVMVAEAWRLPSSPDAGDGKHIIACSAGLLLEEEWTKDYFPFVRLPFCDRVLGYWGQGLAEQLMGTQSEINKLLITISKSINLVGVPRVFLEEGSKVVKAHLNNEVGSIVTYRGIKPSYEVAQCIPAEVYAQLQRLVEFAYQQSGVSALAATSQKPAGLNSGEAIRNYDDLQSDRFASLTKKYEAFYEQLAYQMMDVAKDIAERDGKYQTIYPGKNGTQKVDLPNLDLMEDDFVIQCYDVSALPKDPAGRLQKIVEMIQSGMLDIREGRRLLDFPDLEQVEKLENASEERILKTLDAIVDEGEYNPPDAFMNLELANKLGVQYYNLYACAQLEPEKLEKLRTFISQAQALITQANSPGVPAQNAAQSSPSQPLGVPTARPVSELLPQAPNQGPVQ